jgi:adenine-specific DNA-methyltransferase
MPNVFLESRTMAKEEKLRSASYKHSQKSVQRPDVGVEAQFPNKKIPKTYRYDSSLAPELCWDESGERPFAEWLLNLVTEAAETLKAHKALGTNLDLFGDPQLDVAEKLDAYQHKGPWTNRLVLGDSLQVMNSLLEYEGMGGQVQMIYFDPPYGVKFGSNFQPFVRKRDVKHGADDEMIREPEMVKAYRDTWELGLHSYLAYLRDRLLLAKELLHESGSIFMQISDENLHHVYQVLQQIFGQENFAAIITYAKTTSTTSEGLSIVNDYIIWFYKNKEKAAKGKLLYKFKRPGEVGATGYNKVMLPDGTICPLSDFDEELPAGARICTTGDLTSSKPPGNFPIEFDGRIWRPGRAIGRPMRKELSG